MVSPRWRKVVRDVWLHKARTSLVVLAIAIGVTGAGAVLDTWALIRRATVEEFRASNPAAATLRIDSVDAALLARVRQVSGVREAQARRTVAVAVRTANGQHSGMLFALDDFTDVRIGTVRAEAGAWPPSDGTIAVERSSVEFAETGVGATALGQFGATPPVRLAVSGIARDVGLAPGWMEHVVYGFVSPATLAQLGAPTSLNELQITVRDDGLDREAVRRVAYAVKAEVERAGHAVTDVNVPEPGRHIHAPQINSLLFTQGAFGVLTLLLSAFLVVNLITAMLAGQVREIGVMKAIGARPAQLTAMYLVLALVLGIVACVVAIPTAAVIGRGYARFTAELLNFDVSHVAIPRTMFALQVLVGALLPVLAALVPVLRGCRISVGAALRDQGLAGSARDSAAARVFTRASQVNRPLLLALRNAFRRRQRMVLTLLTLATGGAVFLGAANLRRAVRGSVDLIYETQKFDMILRFPRPWPADSLERTVRTISGVAGAEAWSGGRAAVSHDDGTMGNSFQLTAPPGNTTMLAPAVVAGRWLLPSDDRAIVVNRGLLNEEPALTLGREVPLVIGGNVERWLVVGVVDATPSPAAYITRSAMTRALGVDGVRAVVVASADTTATGKFALIQNIRSELSIRGMSVQSGDLLSAGRASLEDHLLMVVGFLGIMGTLMIVVGGLGLAATMSIAVLERTREIAVMRAIGARHGAIHRMVHAEGLLIATLGWGLAIPLSMPMSVVLGRAFGRIMFAVPVTIWPESTSVLRWLAVVLAVSVVACALPALRATRVSVREALAYE